MHGIVADINDIQAVVICVWVHDLEGNLRMRNSDRFCTECSSFGGGGTM